MRCTKVKSIKNLDARLKSIQCIKENRAKMVHVGLQQYSTPLVSETNLRVNKCFFFSLVLYQTKKIFFNVKEMCAKTKRCIN